MKILQRSSSSSRRAALAESKKLFNSQHFWHPQRKRETNHLSDLPSRPPTPTKPATFCSFWRKLLLLHLSSRQSTHNHIVVMERKEQIGASRSSGQQQTRLQRTRARPSESGDPTAQKNTCPICFNNLTDICAYQPCQHVLCFECAIRNRVLCNQKGCPVCRTECEQVVLAGHRFNDETENLHRFDAVMRKAQDNRNGDPCYGFLFENVTVERAYRKMLTHSCRFCDRPFGEFDDLVRHVRERHDQHYCTICVRTLMLFTWEHKVYMYDELLRHMDEGDPGDKNTHPHPLCELCNFRAFDKDDLYRHSKKRHQACWICERQTNKFVFFNDFYRLYEHMAHLHYVCKVCSNPDEARVTSFPDEDGLAIHTAAEHSEGGGIRPDMLFNFTTTQQRGSGPNDRGGGGGGGRRGGRDHHNRQQDGEDEENVRPRSPVRQNFNMDSAQFPTLGAEMGATSVSGPPTGGAVTSSVAGGKSGGDQPVRAAVDVTPRYAPPKMTENEFPSLGGGGGGGGKGASSRGGPSSTSWSNGSAKVAAPAYTKTVTATAVPKKITRAAPPSLNPATAPAEMFPVLSGPAPTAVAKLNRDWTAVPVKHKKGDASSKTTNHAIKPTATSRWDVLEEDLPAPSPRKLQQKPESPSPSPRGSSGSQVFVQHARNNGDGGFDGTQHSSDLFPSLAKPEGKALPSLFRSTPSSKKKGTGKAAPAPVAAAKPKLQTRKTQNEEIAEKLFRSPGTARDSSDDEGEELVHVPSSHNMAASVVHATPYAMKADDFPGLEKAKPRAKIFVPERKADRVQKHKEVKSDWGNTLIQYETVFVYIAPPNAEERLAALHSKLDPVELKGKTKTLADFQQDLLEEKIPALEFWMESQRIMGKKFPALMPEALVLLPNVAIQQEVFEVAKVPIYGNPQVVKALAQCGVCKQIVRVGQDKELHDRVHKSSR
ncbi:putative Zinc finger protein 598 [Hypsibius exemplaris]|uniref:Zinc finger protein 598 n=1 Tax=Hypsibius exemplaris TaxID=2072580 RepID=A0A1W0WRG6_HYPEX|nr:putative Zinc finger protein 598 [Hypsibius exemplaris]